MRRVFGYFLLGFFFVLVQTALLPEFLPGHYKPDLLLILIIYLGLHESLLRGSMLSFMLGLLQDVFTGSFSGLYGMALLVIFFAVRGTADRLNTENSVLLLIMVFAGTLLQGGIVIFSLAVFADLGFLWPLILRQLVQQAFLNFAAAVLLLLLVPVLQRKAGRYFNLRGLRHVNRRYGS